MKTKTTLLSFLFLSFLSKNITTQRNYIPSNFFLKSFYLLIFTFIISLGTQAQIYSGDLTLSSQLEVDAFNYTEVTGNLTIEGGDITDLTPLLSLTSVGGILNISNNKVLVSLAGLSHLFSFGEGVTISGNDALINLTGLDGLYFPNGKNITITNNNSLTSLVRFRNLSSYYSQGEINISNNDALTSLEGLEHLYSLDGSLTIYNNNALTSFELNNLYYVHGNLTINNNNNLTSLKGLDNLSSVSGLVTVNNNNILNSLEGLDNLYSIQNGLEIRENTLLFSFCSLYKCLKKGTFTGDYLVVDNAINPTQQEIIDGGSCYPIYTGDLTLKYQGEVNLFTYTEVTGTLTINGNYIKNLNGLSTLTAVGGINIRYNPLLTNLEGLENLKSVGVVSINNNNALTNLAIFENLTSTRFLSINNNPSLNSLAGLENITSVEKNLFIANNDALTSLEGLDNITSVGIELDIKENASLTSLAGLGNLSSVGESLIISNNYLLTSLEGLESLTSIRDLITITNNNSLTSLAGLDNITTLGRLAITYNSMLPDLEGLENLISIEDRLSINNNYRLTSLNGLDNLTSVGESMSIENNRKLVSFCALYRLFAEGRLPGYYRIYGNGVNADYQYIVNTGPCNSLPIIDNIIAPEDPIALGNMATVTVEFTDDNLREGLIDWGDGSELAAGVITGQTITWNYTYPEPGVYAVTVKLVDMEDEEIIQTYRYIVVYDPSGGFVTGGGWINSPAGAYIADPVLEGKANFGFTAKYKKGQTVPTGNTEFQFKTGDLNFNSSSFDWLVIAGSKAKFKGVGTINGTGSYEFMISAIDEDSKDKIDKFRIKIWDITNEEFVVYDNQIGEEDDSDPTTEIAGGAIVVHSGNKKKSDVDKTLADDLVISEFNVYPNPFSNTAFIDLQFIESKNITIRVYDMYGRFIGSIYDGLIEKGLKYNFEFSTDNSLSSGIYMVRFVIDNERAITKKIMLTR